MTSPSQSSFDRVRVYLRLAGALQPDRSARELVARVQAMGVQGEAAICAAAIALIQQRRIEGVVLPPVPTPREHTVGMPVHLGARAVGLPAGSWRVLTWGGLRGGISVALALSLPLGADRDTVVSLTYGVVVFSILVQGLSIGYLTRRSVASA